MTHHIATQDIIEPNSSLPLLIALACQGDLGGLPAGTNSVGEITSTIIGLLGR